MRLTGGIVGANTRSSGPFTRGSNISSSGEGASAGRGAPRKLGTRRVVRGRLAVAWRAFSSSSDEQEGDSGPEERARDLLALYDGVRLSVWGGGVAELRKSLRGEGARGSGVMDRLSVSRGGVGERDEGRA